MISPYVRRLRLAAELRALRAEGGLTHEQLAKQIGQSRAQISRLENGHVVDQDDVMNILDALGVDDERWTEIMTIAREAGERGWWESNKAHGRAPGALRQPRGGRRDDPRVPDDVHPGSAPDPRVHPGPQRGRPPGGARSSYTADKAAAGRLGRQRMLRRPGGPDYEVIIDELAIRRAAAPWRSSRRSSTTSLRPSTAAPRSPPGCCRSTPRIEGYIVPRSAFSIYTFNDPGDPDHRRGRHGDRRPRPHRGATTWPATKSSTTGIRDASMTMHDSLELLVDTAKRTNRS